MGRSTLLPIDRATLLEHGPNIEGGAAPCGWARDPYPDALRGQAEGRSERERSRSESMAFLIVLACLLGLQAPPAGDGGDFAEARRAAVEALVKELLELADFAQEKKLFLAREECCREVIAIEPDNPDARQALGYKRDETGEWREPRARPRARNYDAEALAELEKRRGAALDAYRDALIAAIQPKEGLPPWDRVQAVRDELFALAPEDPNLRALFGETKVGDAWVLVETARGQERRPELKQILKEAFEDLPAPKEVEPNERELALGLTFTCALETDWGRVLGTGDRLEVEAVTRALGGGRGYFRGALGNDATYYKGATVFVLGKRGDKQQFLDHHPAVQGAYKDFLASILGSGIQGSNDLADWAEDPKMRLDGIVRIGLGWLLYQAYGVTGDTAWIYEGLGLYMTRELVGTRLTWSAAPSEYMKPREEAALRARLLDPNSNWMNEANKLLGKERAPHLRFVMGKKVAALTTEDMLLAYVAAAYLLEGRPEDAPALFARIGSGVPSPKAIEEVLKMDVFQFHARVARWLGERR